VAEGENYGLPEIGRSSAFDAEHKDIVVEYGQELLKPSTELKVSIVVPVLAELDNDNFWRLLRSLTTQRGVNGKEFEVLYVVNNSIQTVMGEVPNESNRGFEGESAHVRQARFQENQRTIVLIREMNLAREGVDEKNVDEAITRLVEKVVTRGVVISPFEREVMRSYLLSETNFNAVDCSSPTKAFDLDEKTGPIGTAKNIGGHLAFERLAATKDGHGYIDFVDGDCFLSSTYVSNLIEKMNDGAEVVYKPLERQIVDVPDTVKNLGKNDMARMPSFVKYLVGMFTALDYYRDVYEMGYAKPSSTRDKVLVNGQVGGPQLTVDSNFFRELGGYPTISERAEDWQFASNVDFRNLNRKVAMMTEACVNFRIVAGKGQLMADRGQ